MKKVVVFLFFVLSSYSAIAQVYTPYPGDTHYYLQDENQDIYKRESLVEELSEPSQQIYISGKTRYKMSDFDVTVDGDNKKATDELLELSVALGLKTELLVGDLRTELELSTSQRGKREENFDIYSPSNVYEGKIRVANARMNMLFFNLYYDLFPNAKISPYVGGGLGVTQSRISLKSQNLTNSDHLEKWKYKMGWNLSAGVSVNLTKDVKMDLGYRYLDPGRFSTKAPVLGESVKVETPNSSVSLGMRYLF